MQHAHTREEKKNKKLARVPRAGAPSCTPACVARDTPSGKAHHSIRTADAADLGQAAATKPASGSLAHPLEKTEGILFEDEATGRRRGNC